VRLCAICVRRPAVLVEEIDGRKYLVCSECITTEVDEPRPVTMHERVFRFLRRCPGSTCDEVSIALDLRAEPERKHVASCLSRMIRAGIARSEGSHNERLYTLVSGASLAPKRSPKRINMTGRTYGRVLVLGNADRPGGKHWVIRCTCGVEKVVHGDDLRRGATKSCGGPRCRIGGHRKLPAAPAQEATCPAT
jgi:hypothetical protein